MCILRITWQSPDQHCCPVWRVLRGSVVESCATRRLSLHMSQNAPLDAHLRPFATAREEVVLLQKMSRPRKTMYPLRYYVCFGVCLFFKVYKLLQFMRTCKLWNLKPQCYGNCLTCLNCSSIHISITSKLNIFWKNGKLAKLYMNNHRKGRLKCRDLQGSRVVLWYMLVCGNVCRECHQLASRVPGSSSCSISVKDQNTRWNRHVRTTWWISSKPEFLGSQMVGKIMSLSCP